MVQAANGVPVSAAKVFELSLKAMKNKFMALLAESKLDAVTDTSIQWVLTIPAIWKDGAKQFMKEGKLCSINSQAVF